MRSIFRRPGGKMGENLWTNGVVTEGVVTRLWWHNRLEGTYGIEFRVEFPDGSAADVKEGLLIMDHQGLILEGDVVPVRYDPTDHSRIRLDLPALEAPLRNVTVAQNARREATLKRLGIDE